MTSVTVENRQQVDRFPSSARAGWNLVHRIGNMELQDIFCRPYLDDSVPPRLFRDGGVCRVAQVPKHAQVIGSEDL